jgi:hypothetical protein
MNCIFCGKENEAKSIEHIVSESFGNRKYVMVRSSVCDDCNNRFSAFEGKALSNTVFVMERARFGIETKKGKSVTGKVGELQIEGDKAFEKQKITIKGLTEENFVDFDPATGQGHVIVKSFDKSEVATSRMLLKVGLESLYTSQRKLYNKYDFTELRDFLSGRSNTDWPFMTTNAEADKFESIPRFLDKHLLKQIRCWLSYNERDENTLLFKFKYGGVAMTINLLNRNTEWIASYSELDKNGMTYPEHYRKKSGK